MEFLSIIVFLSVVTLISSNGSANPRSLPDHSLKTHCYLSFPTSIKALKDTNIQVNIDLLRGFMQIRAEEVTGDFDFKAGNLIPDY